MFRFIVKILVLALVPLALAACQTTSKSAWTEWKDISETQSAVAFEWPPNAKPVSIKRQGRKERYKYTRQEFWEWGSGEATMVKLPGNRYYNFSKHDTGRLIKVCDDWKRLRKMGLTISESSIKRGVNNVGNYFFAVSDQNNLNQTCFVFHQALPHVGQSGYETTRGVAGGYLTAYECQSKAKISVAKMEQLMVPFVEGIRVQE